MIAMYNILQDSLKRLRILNNIYSDLKIPILIFKKLIFCYIVQNTQVLLINAIDHHQAYLSAVFNKLLKSDEIKYNPLTNIPRFKIQNTEFTYFKNDQIKSLLDALKIRSILLALFCTQWIKVQTTRQ